MPSAVILSPDPENRSGGIERFCQLLRRVLTDGGWDVRLAGPGAPPGRWVDRLGGGTFARSRSTVAGIGVRPDLIVGNNYLGWSAPRGVPRIQVYHGTIAGLTRQAGGGLPLQERARRMTAYAACEALAGRGATVVAVSAGAARELRSGYRLRTSAVIPNGIDTTVFRRGDRAAARRRFGIDGPAALFVGRAEWGKGVDVAVPGARAAGVELLHAGDRELPGSRPLGVLAPEDLAAALSAADCLLLPSRYEACSYAILEAMACGTPVVTTAKGWMHDLLAAVPGYGALIVQPRADSIASVLRTLDRRATPDLVDRAQEFVTTHNSLEAFGRTWLELCTRVLGRTTGATRPRPVTS